MEKSDEVILTQLQAKADVDNPTFTGVVELPAAENVRCAGTELSTTLDSKEPLIIPKRLVFSNVNTTVQRATFVDQNGVAAPEPDTNYHVNVNTGYAWCAGVTTWRTANFDWASRQTTGADVNMQTTGQRFDIQVCRAGKVIASGAWQRTNANVQ